jgi:hypothetical protein
MTDSNMIYNHQYEKSYKIIFDKYFHMYTHSLSREKHIDFSYFEYVNLFNIHFYYFYNVIKTNNIKVLIAANFLHEGDFLLYSIAKEIFNIDIIMFHQSPFPNKMWYTSSIEDFGTFQDLKKLQLNNILIDGLEDKLKVNLFYMKKNLKARFEENCLYKFLFKDFEKLFNKKRNITLKQIYLRYVKCKEYKTNLKKYSVLNVDYNQKYVYFPLHLQPELTTSIHGGEYSDQLLALEQLSAFLPEDYLIYVKENPKQGYYQRDNLFFKRLQSIDKIILVDKNVDTHQLIKHSQFLSIISGTAGWEALLAQKQVLLFGFAWYSSLPGVTKFSDKIEFKSFITNEYNFEKFKQDFMNLISNCFDGVIDFNYSVIYEKYNEKENEQNIYDAIKTILSHKGLE